MQLGKQHGCESIQQLSCKTGINRAQNDQRLTSQKQNSQSPNLITYGRGELGSIGWHDNAADLCKSPLLAEAVVAYRMGCAAGALA
jgi:hypothetical protein